MADRDDVVEAPSDRSRRAACRSVLRLLVGGAAAGLGRAHGSAMKLLDLIPAGARPLQDRGAFELPVQQCELNLLTMFGAGAGKHPDARRLRLPADALWSAVAAFYASKLDAEWQRSEVPEWQLGFRLRAWRQDSLGGAQRLAIAMLDQPVVGSDDPGPFRVLVVAAEG